MPPPLPWSDWSLDRDALDLILAEIDAGRHQILECGSGVSTIVIARQLAELGTGSVTALEHDAAWAAEIRSRLEAEQLTERARIVEAELTSHPLAQAGCGWYDPMALDELPVSGVELLLVDGPPAGVPSIERSRFPALPVLSGRLAADALVVLDDIDRAGERWVLDAWERETPFRFERVAGRRIALGSRSRPA